MSAVIKPKSVYQDVMDAYDFPFSGRPYQVRVINVLGPLVRAGYYLDQGTGKTFCSTVSALYKMMNGATTVIAIMPPILTTGWRRWLEKIKPKAGSREIRPVIYRGTPKQRAKIKLDDYNFVLISMQIFKKDFDKLYRHYAGRRLVVLVDEATSIKNIESKNHQKTHLFADGNDFLALTGTPLSTPMDGYALCKFVAPSIYRNMHQFERLHVLEKDFFGKPKEWMNMELLRDNMTVNAARVLRQEALPDLPPIQIDPLYYELEEAHYKLYTQLAEEQLLALENGGKIDGTTEGSLFNALQQIVVNYDHFSGNPDKVSSALELVEEVLENLDGRKLVVFANYKMSNRLLLRHFQQKYNAVAAFGDISTTQQRRNIDTFIDDPACRLMFLQPTSAGYGVDGLQTVCSDGLFLEMPVVPRDFHQAVARLWRDGLKSKCFIRVAIAEGTMQYGRLAKLMDKDELVGQVCRNFKDLREMVFGRK